MATDGSHDLQLDVLTQSSARRGVLRATRAYEVLLFVFGAALPAIGYVSAFQSPTLLFIGHAFHEEVITVAVLQSLFVSYVTWRCYASSGEPLLRWLTLAFLGFALVYLPHGALTRLSGQHLPLFLLYGPVSRLVMSLFLLSGLLAYGKPSHPVEKRTQSRFWLGWVLGFFALDALVAWVAMGQVLPFQPVRISIEVAAVAVYLVSIALIFLRRSTSWIMVVYAISLAYFAQSSLAFILSKPWNHMWWLAHFVFFCGFTVLSYGVIRAFHTTRAFSLVFSQEETTRQLAAAKAYAEEVAGRLKTANENLEVLAATDPLTGLSNRRHFMAQSQIEFSRAIRAGTPLTVLALDLDHFKRINDEHGHLVGDQVLKRFAEVVAKHLRPTDAIGRMGGEEFMILLSETSGPEARVVAERTRATVEHECVVDAAIAVTVSIGLAGCPVDGTSQDQVFSIADRRLYEAKNRGRNQVVDGG